MILTFPLIKQLKISYLKKLNFELKKIIFTSNQNFL